MLLDPVSARVTEHTFVYCERNVWESLSSRRWSRRLTLFYKMINNLLPEYTRDPVPQLQQSHYSLRNQDVIGQIRARTEKFKSSFYPNCLAEWNELDPEIRLAPSVAIFKKRLISMIRPPAKSVFGIHDPIGLSYLTQLRVGLSKLCFHKFKHNFKDSINPMCPTNDGIETTEHFLLLCPPLRLNVEIFSLEYFNCYDHMDTSIFQTRFWRNFCCMVIDIFQMTSTGIY